MKNKADVLTIRVPALLKRTIEKVSDFQGVSINQFALFAFTKEILEVEDNKYYQALLKNKTREEILSNYDRILSQLTPSKRPPPDWDRV